MDLLADLSWAAKSIKWELVMIHSSKQKPPPAFPPTPQEWSEMITFWGYDTVTRNNDIVVKQTIDIWEDPQKDL